MADPTPPIPYEDFHEVWWIYSPINGVTWSGLRIAHFRKSANGEMLVFITGEADARRIGPRIWRDIIRTELWYRVSQIPVPSFAEVMRAAISDDTPLGGLGGLLGI